jgi:hypothetical protein
VQVIDAPALTVTQATLHLQHCLVVSRTNLMGATGMVGTDATITASHCEFEGGSPYYGLGGGGFPKPGIHLLRCTLHACALTVRGGSQGFGNLGAPAVELGLNSRVWLSDSNLVAGKNSCAISALPWISQFDRVTLVNTTTGCPTPPAGGFLLAVVQPDVLQPASVFTLRYQTEPNGIVFVFAGLTWTRSTSGRCWRNRRGSPTRPASWPGFCSPMPTAQQLPPGRSQQVRLPTSPCGSKA